MYCLKAANLQWLWSTWNCADFEGSAFGTSLVTFALAYINIKNNVTTKTSNIFHFVYTLTNMNSFMVHVVRIVHRHCLQNTFRSCFCCGFPFAWSFSWFRTCRLLHIKWHIPASCLYFQDQLPLAFCYIDTLLTVYDIYIVLFLAQRCSSFFKKHFNW